MSQPGLDLGFEDDPADPTYSVGELADAVNAVLRRGFRDGVWVRGEIQGLLQRANGHVWFNLTDDGDGGRATVAVVLFAGAANRMLPMLRRHRIRLEDGLTVRIHGHLDFYGPTGRLTLVMDQLDARFTLGQLAAQRDQLLRALVAEGLLDRNRRLPLPAVPLRVGVVTSRDSAAWHDFRAELHRSGLAFRLRVADVRVQGEGAAEGIAGAVARLGTHAVDVVVVIRGGGARTDLATFDAEAIARAIAACPVPVLTGLGHEIDRSVADEVAHTALKTPTACAAALVERVQRYLAAVDGAWAAIARRSAQALERAEAGLGETARHLARSTTVAVELAAQRLDHAAVRLRREAEVGVAGASRRVDTAATRLGPAAQRRTDQAAGELAVLEARAHALDPARTLARGWSITRTAAGALVRDAAALAPGDEIITTLAAGAARSRVEGIVDAGTEP